MVRLPVGSAGVASGDILFDTEALLSEVNLLKVLEHAFLAKVMLAIMNIAKKIWISGNGITRRSLPLLSRLYNRLSTRQKGWPGFEAVATSSLCF